MDGFIHEFQIIFGFVQNKYYRENTSKLKKYSGVSIPVRLLNYMVDTKLELLARHINKIKWG
jgi:hypothetical protein